MPAGKDPLSAENKEILRRWIDEGANWVADAAQNASEPSWWAFRKPKLIPQPKTKNLRWIRSPIDAFILQKLEERELQPATPAKKLILLRRAKFDLHGLPPTAQEAEEFLADHSPEAFAKLVDRLLASPRYGEKWGRHWLDVARYADSTGLDEDLSLPYSWRYRDYVIDAFNRDLPYDQFVKEQLAGDLLPPDKSEEAINVRGIVATGFLALGPKPLAQQDKVKAAYDVCSEAAPLCAQSKASHLSFYAWRALPG